MEIWAKHPRLIIACLDARSAKAVYEKQASSPRDMTPDEVDWLMELDTLAERAMGESGRAQEKREAEAELNSFADLPY